MLFYKDLSEKLNEILGLEQSAVGIVLLNDCKYLEDYNSNVKYTFCQFLMRAREGEKLLANADNIVCANGASALGFRPVPEKLINGEFLENLGTLKKEAAKKTLEVMPRFELKKYSGIALSPLADVDFEPDIVVIESKPEHLMWLNLAVIYQEGGRLGFSTSISNGTCVDITVIPHLTQKINVSLGCYGCRNATSIPDEFLLAGFPGNQLESIVNSLALIHQKAMPRTRGKKAYKRLIDNKNEK